MSQIELVIPRELKSPNTWNGRHWRYKHRESQEWQTEIAVQLLTDAGKKNIYAILIAMNAVPPKRRCEAKRHVAIVRGVPSLRNFIRDDDNLRFATKPLNDALKRLGLIRDDSRKWLEQETPVQEVSTDGKYYTRIQIREI